MRQEARARDSRMAKVRRVRDGDMRSVWPDQFSDRFPQAINANFVDVVARDLAEVIAPLPTLACSSGTMKSEADKRRATRKNRIGSNFWLQSRLEQRMFYGADQYNSYGFLPSWVEPDFDAKRPVIRIEDPTGFYFRLDRFNKVRECAKVWKQSPGDLVAQFPESRAAILYDSNGQPYGDCPDIEVVRWIDGTNVTLYLPDRNNTILASYAHRMSRCPVEIALRPGLHMDPRGQFDDVIYVQLAKAILAQLTLEATHKAVQAPIAVPEDITELQLGPDAVIQTQNPQNVRRVGIDVPGEAFAQGQLLDQELKIGARYPDARLGVAQASVITGKGIEALMGGFDTQIKSAQTQLGRMLAEITSLCFEMDEKFWPNKREKIDGIAAGETYEMTYTPRVDIAGNYSCDITYGFAAGMSPQNAFIMLLQAQGAGLVERDLVRRQSPWGIDPEQTQRNIDVEELEDGIKQGVLAALQSSGQLLASGQTDLAMFFFNVTNDMIAGRQNGKPLNEILTASMQAFQQQQQEQAAAQAAAQQAAGAAGPGGAGIPGVGADGLPPGVAPGQAGMPPGGMPTVQDLVTGFTGAGRPNMSANVRRRLPAQG